MCDRFVRAEQRQQLHYSQTGSLLYSNQVYK